MPDPQNTSDPSSPEKGPGCPSAGRTAVAGPGLATTPGSPTGGPVQTIAPEPAAALCGFEHDQWDIVRMRRRCIAPAGHSQGLFAYDHGPWERVPEPSRVTALAAPATPPAARQSAEERPEVAGEPESGQDGAAGREGLRDRSRWYLAPIARTYPSGQPDDVHLAIYLWDPRVDAWVTGSSLCGYTVNGNTPANLPALPADTNVTCPECLHRQPDFEWRFDCHGCNRECLDGGWHTLRWGYCGHAVEPPPLVSMCVVYTDADGEKSFGFDLYSVADLAAFIEPALREVGIRLGPTARAMLQDGHEVWLSSDEIGRLALAAADAIVTHSNRDAT